MGELVETAGCLHLYVSQAAGEEPDECLDATVQPGGTQRVLSPPAFHPRPHTSSPTQQPGQRATLDMPLVTAMQFQTWADLTNFC